MRRLGRLGCVGAGRSSTGTIGGRSRKGSSNGASSEAESVSMLAAKDTGFSWSVLIQTQNGLGWSGNSRPGGPSTGGGVGVAACGAAVAAT